jgi:parvulin-like peptidyl-prolyl cis-trans isomerase-like protein
MKSALRLHRIVPGAIVVSAAFACGGAPSGGVSSAASSKSGPSGESAAERCLDVAGAKRERKPSEPAKITAKHVLVRYSGAKRAPETITRTREQACLRAEEALTKLKEGMSFAEVVRLYSDESGAATREGTIGTIERTDVAAAFADAAFELNAGEVSQVVETNFGFHVILRVE